MPLTLLVSVAAFVGVAALVGGISLMLRGSTDNVAEDRLGMLTGKSNPRKRAEQEATVIARPLDEVPNILEDFASRFLNLRLFLEQANMSVSPSNFVIASAVLFVVGCIIYALTGLPLIFAPLVGLCFGLMPAGVAWFRRRRRKSQFAKQLPEALELIARALRAGHSLGSGFHLVASEMAEPISTP